MRALRILLILGSLLAIVFVAADRITVHFAEQEAADRIHARQGIAGHTTVSIRGFPFLTQVAGKHLDAIELHLNGVKSNEGEEGQVVISEMSATLKDVSLGDGYHSAVAGSAHGTALVSFDQLAQKSRERIRKIEFAGDDKVKITTDVSVAGRLVQATAVAVIRADGSRTLSLDVPDADSVTPRGLYGDVSDSVAFSYPVRGLPQGLTLQDVTVTPEGISIELTGENVSLAG